MIVGRVQQLTRSSLPDRPRQGTRPQAETVRAVIDTIGNKLIATGKDIPAVQFPWSDLAFGFELSGATVTIFAGTLRIHGVGIFPVAEADIVMSGSTEFIYLAHVRDHSGTNLARSLTEPVTTSNELRFPLYKFVSPVAGSYNLDRILHMGDINLDTPLRGS